MKPNLEQRFAFEVGLRLTDAESELRSLALTMIVANLLAHKSLSVLLAALFSIDKSPLEANPADDRIAFWIEYGDKPAVLAHQANIKELELAARVVYAVGGIELVCLTGCDGKWCIERSLHGSQDHILWSWQEGEEAK